MWDVGRLIILSYDDIRQEPKKSTPPCNHDRMPLESGDVLLFRAVSSQLPSALRGLTSVFGMGTGGTLLL